MKLFVFIALAALCHYTNAQSCAADESSQCCEWAGQGECDSNPYYMRVSCQTSCGSCGCTVEDAASCSVNVPDECKSDGSGTTPAGGTTTESNGATTTAAKSNGSSGSCSNGDDGDEKCCEWALDGECDKNPYYMKVNCQKACGTCGCTVSDAETCKITVDPSCSDGATTTTAAEATTEASNVVDESLDTADEATDEALDTADEATDESLDTADEATDEAFDTADEATDEATGTEAEATAGETTATASASGSGGKSGEKSGEKSDKNLTASSDCKNSHELCNFWASVGECEKNPVWMKPNCQAACDACSSNGDTTSGGSGASSDGCSNGNELCNFWASVGECEKNSVWMHPNCKKACKMC